MHRKERQFSTVRLLFLLSGANSLKVKGQKRIMLSFFSKILLVLLREPSNRRAARKSREPSKKKVGYEQRLEELSKSITSVTALLPLLLCLFFSLVHCRCSLSTYRFSFSKQRITSVFSSSAIFLERKQKPSCFLGFCLGDNP